MRRAELVWWRILGVVLILFGLTLFFSPRISYTTTENIRHTRYTVKRPKMLAIPRPVAFLVVTAEVIVLVVIGRKARP